MFKTFLTKISEYISDVKIVDDNFVIPCNPDHILQVANVLPEDTKYRRGPEVEITITLDCDKCKLLYYELIYVNVNSDFPEFRMYMWYDRYNKNILYNFINESVCYISRTLISKAMAVDHKIYVYDDLYIYWVNYEKYTIGNLTTDNYGTVIQYLKSYFDELLLPDINNIIVEYLLYDIKYYTK